MLKQCGGFFLESQKIIVKGKLVKINLPEKYRVPENLTVENMIDCIAKRYSQDTDHIADTKTQYDYYLVKLWSAQEYVSDLYIQKNYYSGS